MVTRINEKGNLEVLHPETNSYLPAVAPVPIKGGTSATLSKLQFDIIENINDVATIIQIFCEEFEKLFDSMLESMNDSEVGIRKYLLEINATLASLILKQADIITSLENVRTAVNQARATSSVPAIINILLTTNQETSFSFPQGTKKFSLKCRGNSTETTAALKYAYTAGKLASNPTSGQSGFYVLPEGQEEVEENLFLSTPLTIFFSAPAAAWVSIKYWV